MREDGPSEDVPLLVGTSTASCSTEESSTKQSQQPLSSKQMAGVAAVATTALATWTQSFYETTKGFYAQEERQEEGQGREQEFEKENQRETHNQREEPPTISTIKCKDTEEQENNSTDLQEIIALLLIDPILIELVQCMDGGVDCDVLDTPFDEAQRDRYNTYSWAKDDKQTMLRQRREATARDVTTNLADLVALKRHVAKVRRIQKDDEQQQRLDVAHQSDEDAVQYVQFGIVTGHISAVIEIGEDGSGSGGNSGGYGRTPPTSIVEIEPQHHEQERKTTSSIVMNQTISDMTTESSTFIRTASSSSAASLTAANNRDLKKPHEGVGTDAASTMPSERGQSSCKGKDTDDTACVNHMKKDVAEALLKESGSNSDDFHTENTEASSSPDKYALSTDASSPKHPMSRVHFASTIVSETRERPRIDPEEVHELFYSRSDISRFEDEAYDSDGYTITPMSSKGSDVGEDDAKRTPTPTDPAKAEDFVAADLISEIAGVFGYMGVLR